MKIKFNSNLKSKNSLNELNLKCENSLNSYRISKIKKNIEIQRDESIFDKVKSEINWNFCEKTKVKQLSAQFIDKLCVNPEEFDLFECGNYGLCGTKAISWLLFHDEKFHPIRRYLMFIEENPFRTLSDLKKFSKLNANRKDPTEGIMVQDILSLQYNLDFGIEIHHNIKQKSKYSETIQELLEDIHINNVSNEFSTKINLFFETVSKKRISHICHDSQK